MQGNDRFNPIDYRIAHFRPQMLTTLSAWVEHIPFAFALVEMCRPNSFVELGTHGGDSYCAFCQAVELLKLPTKCTAVDTWAGDAHSGAYGEAVLANLKQYHDSRYASFSKLLRMTFDQALPQFADASIDLLHIDGLHTYDAVKHDFDSWLPKLSSRGAVIMHDTEVRDMDFGVWKLWGEVSKKFPSMNFRHGYGLGVLAVGADAPAPLLRFIQLGNSDRSLCGYFEHLGSIVSLLRAMRMVSQFTARTQTLLQQRKRLLNQPTSPVKPDGLLEDPARYMAQLLDDVAEVVQSDVAGKGLSMKIELDPII